MGHVKAWLAAGLLACALPGAACGDTLVDNVDGFTLDDQGRIERLTGLVIGRDGRVVQVLHSGEKRPQRPDYYVDGKGRVLMPGLVDSHVNLMKLGLASLVLDLAPAKSVAEVQARVAAYAAAHPDRKWILGRGWNGAAWQTGRAPTAADLDAVVKDRPVWLESADGHAGWANSAALAAAGISATTRDPPGGRIERIGATKTPSGLLLESAMDAARRAAPQPKAADRDAAFAAAQNLLLARGITAVSDVGTSMEEWQAYRRAGDTGSLRIRIAAYADGTEAMQLIGGASPGPWLYEDRLHLNGVALTLDGGLSTRGAWLKAPYADAPGKSGLPRLTPAQLRNLMSRAAMDDFQIAVDAGGDAATAAVLDAIDELALTYKGDRRWRIEKAHNVDPADLARFAKLGLIASMQPEWLAANRTLAETRLGLLRVGGVAAWKSLSQAGATLAFGSGAPASAPDPFAGIAAAITRQGADSEPFGGWQPQEHLSFEAALAAWSTGGARAAMAEGRFGRLAPGFRADFLLIDRDPLLSSPSEIRQVRVIETWIGGSKAWAAP